MADREISKTGTAEDERISVLEKNLRLMESRVNVLIDDLLDFKAVAGTMSRQQKEDGEVAPETVSIGPPLQSAAVPSGACAIIRADAQQSGLPPVPPEQNMVRIMQADGTMKMEPRYGDAKTR
jgi:hypothetical protein